MSSMMDLMTRGEKIVYTKIELLNIIKVTMCNKNQLRWSALADALQLGA